MQMPFFVYVLAPLVALLFGAQIVIKTRSAARRARGIARSWRNVMAVDRQRPTTGELATALAVGAHMSLNHGVSWNAIRDDANSATKTYQLLQSQWNVRNPGDLWECLEDLLDDETGDPVADFVLAVRHDLGIPGAGTWRQTVTDRARAQGVPETTLDEMTATIDRVLRYEQRFRADGLLAGDAVVRSLLGYDWARAVNMARWGLQIRYLTEPQAREYVLRAGKRAFGHYDSWAGLSAGYALGRVLRFDNDEFDVWYSTVLEPHQTLFSDPASPWLTLAWPGRP